MKEEIGSLDEIVDHPEVDVRISGILNRHRQKYAGATPIPFKNRFGKLIRDVSLVGLTGSLGYTVLYASQGNKDYESMGALAILSAFACIVGQYLHKR